jgi:hypothetical protein
MKLTKILAYWLMTRAFEKDKPDKLSGFLLPTQAGAGGRGSGTSLLDLFPSTSATTSLKFTPF